MMRSLLIIILGGAIAWLVLQLIRTVKSIAPGKSEGPDDLVSNGKIIDAEFEDVEPNDQEGQT